MKATQNLFFPLVSCSFSVCLNIPQGFFSWLSVLFHGWFSMYVKVAGCCQPRFSHCASRLSLPLRQSAGTALWPSTLFMVLSSNFSISDCLWAHPRRKGEPGFLSSCFSESSNIWSAGWAAGTPQRKGIRRGVRSAQLQRCHCSWVWGQGNNETPHKAACFDLCWAALRFCFFWQESGDPRNHVGPGFYHLELHFALLPLKILKTCAAFDV